MKIRKLFCLLGVVLLLCGGLWAQAQYTFKTYAAPPNGHDLVLTGINNKGLMVGIYLRGPRDSDLRGIVLSPQGFKEIKIPNGSDVVPAGINNRNEISGRVFFPYPKTVGFIRFPNLAVQVYRIPGALITEGGSLNDADTTVGDFQGQDGNFHGFARSRIRKVTVIDYPGAADTSVLGINNAGKMVGLYFTPNRVVHGFLVDGGVFTTIDHRGAHSTNLTGINNLGEIAGIFCGSTIETCHGFSYYQGHFKTIDVPGAVFTEALGINDSGIVVGRYWRGNQSYGFKATPVAQPAAQE